MLAAVIEAVKIDVDNLMPLVIRHLVEHRIPGDAGMAPLLKKLNPHSQAWPIFRVQTEHPTDKKWYP